MRLILCEMKKVFKGPMVWIALVIAIAVNIVQIISGSAAPVLSTDIQELKDRYAYFAGPITSEWSQRYQQEADQILTDPQYQVSEEEAEAIIQKYVNEWGYTEETVRDNGALFLNEAGVTAHEKYEDVTVAANFYKYAMDFGEQMAQYYGDTYPGEKGEALADYTLERYTYLANEYVANYNYNFGYENIRKIMTVYIRTGCFSCSGSDFFFRVFPADRRAAAYIPKWEKAAGTWKTGGRTVDRGYPLEHYNRFECSHYSGAVWNNRMGDILAGLDLNGGPFPLESGNCNSGGNFHKPAWHAVFSVYTDAGFFNLQKSVGQHHYWRCDPSVSCI